MADAREIVERLNARAEEVCRHLLPDGKRLGHEWVGGRLADGEGGDSLKVVLAGTKVGIWSDFGAGGDHKGDLLDLWRQARSLSFREAFAEASRWLGLNGQRRFEGARERTYRKPSPPVGMGPAAPGTKVDEYLRGERGLYPETIRAYRVMEAPAWEGAREDGSPYRQDGPWILFPYFRPGETGPYLANIKWLHVNRRPGGPGKKPQKIVIQERGSEPCLFGWHTVPDDAREVAICEGEIDAMTVHQWGIPALSVPMGAGTGEKQSWVEHDFDFLERFETIYLVFDNDEEGRKTVPDLIGRLGAHRCRVVKLPWKDPNEGLVTHGIDAGAAKSLFEASAYLEPEELKSAAAFADEVVRAFYPASEVEEGIALPWLMLRKLRLRAGEVTLWTGINFGGKSQMIGQAILHACDAGWRCFEASLEHPAEQLLKRKVRQITGREQPLVDEIREAMAWFDGRLWIYDVVGRVDRGRLIEVMRYARRRYNCRLFVVDSLMRCGINEDDYNSQGDFMDDLLVFARVEQGHVILVAHPAKPKDETRPVGRLAIKGTGKLSDLAHNTIETWRNRVKEQKLSDIADDEKLLPEERAAKQNDLYYQPDTLLIVDKQKNGSSWSGTIRMWFDPAAQSWRDERAGNLPPFLTAPARHQSDLV